MRIAIYERQFIVIVVATLEKVIQMLNSTNCLIRLLVECFRFRMPVNYKAFFVQKHCMTILEFPEILELVNFCTLMRFFCQTIKQFKVKIFGIHKLLRQDKMFWEPLNFFQWKCLSVFVFSWQNVWEHCLLLNLCIVNI